MRPELGPQSMAKRVSREKLSCVKLPAFFKQHFEIAAALGWPETQFPGQLGDRAFRRFHARIVGKQLQFDKRTDSFDFVERPFHLLVVRINLESSPPLSHAGNRRKPQHPQQLVEPGSLYVVLSERKLELMTRLGTRHE